MLDLNSLLTNPVFAGMVGGVGFSAVLYQLKAVPKQAFDVMKRQLTTYIEVDNHEEMFERLMVYLTNSPHVNKTRWLRMVEYYDEGEQKWTYRPTFGSGWHFFKDNGTRFLLHRQTESGDKGGSNTLKRRETLTIRTLGRSQKPIRELMKRAAEVYKSTSTIRVYVWHAGSYMLVDRKILRSLDTVFLPKEQKSKIIRDLDRFIASKEDYKQKGIPYKRGYLFKGPPGTGKTTLAFAIACYLNKPLYIVNLNTAGGDTGIQAAFNYIESGSIVVIEDIDTQSIVKERTNIKPANDNKEDDSSTFKITLSGLLNAIDGIGARDNRILIMTSNHAENLDAALIRPGRIDLIEEIGLMEKPEAVEMVKTFGLPPEWVNDNVSFPVAPSALQNKLLQEVA